MQHIKSINQHAILNFTDGHLRSTVSLRLMVVFFALVITGCVGLQKKQPSNTIINASAETAISPQLLKEELDLIRQYIITVHPEPFARISEIEFDTQFLAIKQAIQLPLTRADFYLRIAPLLVMLKDVHSYIQLPIDNHGVFKNQNERLFPLAVILEVEHREVDTLSADVSANEKNQSFNQYLYVAADLAKPNQTNLSQSQLSKHKKIPAGAKITAVNQVPVKHLLNVMRRLTSQETLSGQSRKIQMSFAELLAAMGYASEYYQVDYVWRGEPFTQKRLGLKIQKNKRKTSKPPSYYGFSQLNNNTALLWLNDFNQDPQVFADYLAEKFQLMADIGIQHVIVDLRFNSGGLSHNTRQLLSYLSDKKIQWATKGTIRTSHELKKQHYAKLKQRRVDKYNWSLSWLPLEWTNSLQYSIWWANAGDSVDIDIEPIKPAESIEREVLPSLWVLTNGYCYSACSFANAAIKANDLGIIIGEPVGSRVNKQFAYPIDFKLPHSQLVLTLPTMRLQLNQPNSSRLIRPDVFIKRTQIDIINRRDPSMLKALEMIEQLSY